jgi:small GTP-binding protein
MPSKSQFRIVTLGDASVGKTSILLQLIEHRFNTQEAATIGANFLEYSTTIDGEPITLQIWDTAGQERFRAIAPVYFRNADAAIAVFALNVPETFDNLPEQIQTFLTTAGDAPVVIAANKVDLTDNIAVPPDRIQDFAASGGWDAFSTSAKTGDGIDQLISALVRRIRAAAAHPDAAAPTLTIEETNAGCC